MKDYIGVKVVAAEPMSRGAYNEYRGWKIPSDENPEDEGYHIRYPDGYESWCPKKQFEEAYRRYDGTKLPSTAILMNSGDYKDRFKAEYKQLVIRYKGLKCMLEKWDNGTLEFKPTCPRSTYNMQIDAMVNYIAILEVECPSKNGVSFNQRRDILEKKERDFIAEHVSVYAAKYDYVKNRTKVDSEREFFAECFAEYMMSDNPRKTAKIFGEIIETALGR